MLMTSFRRSSRSRLLRAFCLIIAAFGFCDLISLISSRHHQQSASKPPPDSRGQRLFIASIHWNNEQILRSNWNRAILELVEFFGADNVYVSIYESGSWDDTKDALRELDRDLESLRVRRTITLDESTHKDEIQKPFTTGWIDTPRGKKELRRIPYLAKLRNLVLKPFHTLALEGTKFNKVLFLNDVVFTTEDVSRLLATRDGEYAAACSLDFAKAPHYYDTFALRDSDGHEAVSSTFPYFRSKASRNAILAGQPVPVQSCWNGIIAFDATPFYEPDPLQFRGVPDSLALHHVEGSECCLIHADNPLTPTQGVWMNPDVRVGYSPQAYTAVHPGSYWPSIFGRIWGIWVNRLWRWSTTSAFKEATIKTRLSKWKAENAEVLEPGPQCLINEMQVLIENGWAHV
ncbi:alpha-1,3-mannosyltransferase, partial [Lecanoromycetidae sp. Uapishka_2]